MLDQKDFKKDGELYKINLGPVHMKGISVAGINTHLSVPELKIGFDVGYSHPSILSHKKYFITHSHMDHAAGIPYIISNKALNKQTDAKFYMPSNMPGPMDRIMREWSGLEGHDYTWNFEEMKPEETVSLSAQWAVRAFTTFHRVQSQGYLLSQTKSKLKPEYLSLSGPEIRDLKQAGEEIEELSEIPFLAITGDTKVEVLKENPILLRVKYLVIETTYATSVKTVESCREWGHIHFDELIPFLKEFEGENIILKHFSRRHNFKEILQVLDEKVQEPGLRKKILVLPF